MKTLLLARHVKSSWDDMSCPDFDRGLHKKGRKHLQLVSAELVKKFQKPDLIVTSPAKRSRKTAEGYATAWGYKKKKIQDLESMYMASLPTLLYVLERTDESCETLLLVGHNPGLTELINYCGYSLENLPTGGVVVFAYKGETRGHFEPGKCVFKGLREPKTLTA